MLYGVILILIATLGVVIVMLWQSNKEVKSIKQQLQMIVDGFSHTPLKTVSNNKEAQKLIEMINQFLLRFNTLSTQYQITDAQNKMMISSISHDFRTPLTSILGYIQMLEQEQDEARRQVYFGIVTERIKVLSTMIEDFYQLSLLESNEYPIHLEQVNISLLLIDQVTMFYHDLNRHFATVAVNIAETQITTITDKNMFIRLIGNLLKNALVHGYQSCELSLEESAAAYHLVFKNKVYAGQEINILQLFERTYRGDYSRQQTSSGLGLSIAKEIAEQLGFTLTADILGDEIFFDLVVPIKNDETD